MIGHLPELTESEIDGRPILTPVTLPITINGRIFPREDVDIWTVTGKQGHVDRDEEAALYESILRKQFVDPERILQHAGHWVAGRFPASASA